MVFTLYFSINVLTLTFDKYISEYPGLIHFIYVDRNSDSLIAPSVVLRKGQLKGVSTLKKKVNASF